MIGTGGGTASCFTLLVAAAVRRGRAVIVRPMAFNFSELKIGRGPNLTRETGQVVQLFQSLQATAEDPDAPRLEREEAQGMLEELYTRVQNRIEELEDFYVEHDADERSLLFEKQRMALRRLLHTYCVSNEVRSRAESSKAAAAKATTKTNKAPAAAASSSSALVAQPPGHDGGSRSRASAPPKGNLTNSTRKKLDRSARPAGGADSVAGASSSTAITPLYDWETTGGDGGAGDSGQPPPLDPFEQPMVTFDIVLTEQEFFLYTSRLREYSVRQRAKKVSTCVGCS